MGRLFLSGQTTCALLLGAGLLLRAQAALRSEPEVAQHAAVEAPRTQPSDMFGDQTIRARSPRVVRSTETAAATARSGNVRTHSRKGIAHRQGRVSKAKSGVRVASKSFRRG